MRSRGEGRKGGRGKIRNSEIEKFNFLLRKGSVGGDGPFSQGEEGGIPRWEIIAGVGSRGEKKNLFFLGPLNSYAGKGVVQSETHEWPLLFSLRPANKNNLQSRDGTEFNLRFLCAHPGKLEVAGKIENSEDEGPCFSQQSMCMQASQPGSSVIFCV